MLFCYFAYFIITDFLNKINIFLRKGAKVLEIRKYGKSYSRFEEILKEKSIKPYRVATDLNFSPMLLSDWKNDKSKPKLDTMILIANYLDVPVTDFSDLESEG